jgi:hypothetical protein
MAWCCNVTQGLKEQRNLLEQQLKELRGSLHGASQRIKDAAKQQQAAAQAFEQSLAACTKLLGPELLPQDGLPSRTQLQQLAEQLQQQAAQAPER